MTHRRWPAEWEPQSAIWLSWPHNRETWPGHFEGVPAAFARFVRATAEVVPVQILVDPAAAGDAEKHVGGVVGVTLVECPTNDCWIRDYGPTFVIDSSDGDESATDRSLSVVGIDWRYNAWGGKYPPWDRDAAAAERIVRSARQRDPRIRREESPLCCEGGALETDGLGRLLTTPECLITETRNPGWDQERIAHELHRRLGITEILWIDGGGLEGDDTDGHVDQLARFVDERNVVCAVCDDASDPNHEPLEANYRQLRIWGRQTDPEVEVHRLPIPEPRRIEGQRVPESYCNFLIVGGSRVIVPQFAQPAADERAVAILTELMPGMEIYPLEASELVWGLGAFHCASQQQPARV
ncbi:agmatine deiminase family protein [Candidatus Laterigemmans baculatus]|uniref:agmatine deiminase family protein n=1 Tax=Candidatus Laterigemmans baculatus TaxID=2770505 RepID=UPI0013DBE09C|nr:agmatine deiminase family protein [Candidatus Laterigemmans baculatus]